MDLTITRYRRIVKKINELERSLLHIPDKDLRAKTDLLRMRLKSVKSLDLLLPEAFALVREAAKRAVGLRAYDVQLMGAIGAHEGKIVEMKTGEGKTLTIIFAAYLNALEGNGVHVITANDYLAERDAVWSNRVYQLLGMSVGYITSRTHDFDRQVSYASDITYITNNEVCFDFLKDNMLYDSVNRRQRGLHYAIIDEADSVLIDEAQTPLVISDNQAPEEKDKDNFRRLNLAVKQLEKDLDFKVDPKSHTVSLTINGIKKLERLVNVENLYGDNKEDYLYYIERLLKAHHLFQRDKDYIVEDGKIIIVDEFTGRLMHNHRYYQGLHQAIEAKEGADIYSETETLAYITFQNFFLRYHKFSGLTGTALTSEKEFRMIYRKEVVAIPTNKPVCRLDYPDRFFLTWEDKIRYLAWATQEYFYKRRAVLIGTRSVAKSQQVQEALITENIPSNVLNAKHTKREAEVIAQAGQSQTVTVATNMAGRGTDILLDEHVRDEGGLVIYGTERHNARRIDNQLVGRGGRQGDPGQTQFLISGEDGLIRIYFKDKYEQEIKKHHSYEKGIESRRLANILKKAQQQFENLFFDQRILTFEFDKVLETHRESFYRQRQRVLEDDNLKAETLVIFKHEIYKLLLKQKPKDRKILLAKEMIAVRQKLAGWAENGWLKFKIDFTKNYAFARALEAFYQAMADYYEDFEKYVSEAEMRKLEKVTTLKVLDLMWVEHLKRVEQLQDAAMVNSINRADFFGEYEIQMSRLYRQFLASIPNILCQTLLKTMNRVWELKKHQQPTSVPTSHLN